MFLNDWAEYINNYDGAYAIEYTRQHTEIPIFAVTLYLVFIFQVPNVLPNAMSLRFFNAVWNLLLSVFSIAGAIVVVPHLIKGVWQHGLIYTVCTDPAAWYKNGPVGFYVCMFIFSKIPELVDTVFLVLQKKQVIFLHWFHHITVLLYCWHAFALEIAPGIWFAGMNYFVHSIMYTYYFCGLIGLRKAVKPIAPIVTTLQLLQMVGGVAVTVTSGYIHYQDASSCKVDPSNLKLALGMYTSYFVLFAILFHNLYIKPKAAGPIKTGCPDIAQSCNVNDATGFFHDKDKEDAVKKPESKKTK